MAMKVREEELLLSVADVLLVDIDTGMEYATASLKSHNISQTVDTSEIRAGRNNAVVATLESNKTITVEIEDVLWMQKLRKINELHYVFYHKL